MKNEIEREIPEIKTEINKKSEIKKIGDSSLINNISLSSNSKRVLIFRLILISLACIFVPMTTVIDKKLELIEKKYMLKNLIETLENIFFLKNKIIKKI